MVLSDPVNVRGKDGNQITTKLFVIVFWWPGHQREGCCPKVCALTIATGGRPRCHGTHPIWFLIQKLYLKNIIAIYCKPRQ